jgi:RHS repeat-associated protein
VYDLWGRRIAKLLDTDGDNDYDSETHYILDGERYERGNPGDHIVLTFDANEDLINRYLYGPAVDQILADEPVTSTSTAGNVLWPLTDNLGTIRDIATITNHLQFGSFGNVTSESNSTIEHRFAFTGRELDEETNSLHYRARILDSATARFLSNDPIRDDYNNLARYVGNGPANATDPSGLEIAGPGYNPYQLSPPPKPGDDAYLGYYFFWPWRASPNSDGWDKLMVCGKFVGWGMAIVGTGGIILAPAVPVPAEAATVQSLAQIAPHLADDAIINIGSTARNVINPPLGRSHFFRWGDIKHLTPQQVQTLIGDLASVGPQGGGIRFIRVAANANKCAKVPGKTGYYEYFFDTAVEVLSNIPMP